MNHYLKERPDLQTLLVVSSDEQKLELTSSILASLNLVSIPILEANKILNLVQQYQPDLIILNLGWLQLVNSQLITALRLDWLTRNIPILVVANANPMARKSIAKLDFDTCLMKPYSTLELERAICSLISVPACEAYC